MESAPNPDTGHIDELLEDLEISFTVRRRDELDTGDRIALEELLEQEGVSRENLEQDGR